MVANISAATGPGIPVHHGVLRSDQISDECFRTDWRPYRDVSGRCKFRRTFIS